MTNQEALSEALALSILAGDHELGVLVETVEGARCLAESAVADIGVDRYVAAYGITAETLSGEFTMFSVVYDRMDAEAIGAALAACNDLEASLRRLLADLEMSPEQQTCFLQPGLPIFQDTIVAELNQDHHLVDELGSRLNNLSAQCLAL